MTHFVASHAADVDRGALVAQALVTVVARDPRVEAAYQHWLEAHDLPRLIRRVLKRETVANAQAVRDAIVADRPDDRPLLDGLLSDLGLRHYDWLASVLRATWMASALGAATGQPVRLQLSTQTITASLEPGESPTAFARRVRRTELARWPARGRRAIKKRGALERDVWWFYRAEVQQPIETITDLAREYARAEGRLTDAQSVVQNSIRRAKILLSGTRVSLPAPPRLNSVPLFRHFRARVQALSTFSVKKTDNTCTIPYYMGPGRLGERLGLSAATLWRMRRRGELPEPVRLSPGRVAWATPVIEEWLKQRTEASRTRADGTSR